MKKKRKPKFKSGSGLMNVTFIGDYVLLFGSGGGGGSGGKSVEVKLNRPKKKKGKKK